MKKILLIILLITSFFVLSCNNNSTNPSALPLGITVNPYGVTPLSAVYVKPSVNIAPVTVKVKGLYGEPDIIHTYPIGYGTEFEIHGMFPESDNVIEINDGGRIITKNVSIGSISLLNGYIPQKRYDVKINNLEEKYPNNPDLYFVNIAFDWPGTLGISKNGYIRYLNIIKSYIFKTYIDNSKILFVNSSDGGDQNAGLYDLLGNRLIKYPIPSHHDAIKVNDNYIYLSHSSWGYEDRLVEMSASGTKLKELSFGKLIQNALDLKTYPEDESVFKQIVFGEDVNNIYQDSSGQQKNIDWLHANSLVYDSSSDILYVSSRHRGVLAIDYSNWKLIWWMADETLWLNVSDNMANSIPYDVHFKDLKSLDVYRVKADGMDDGPKNQHALFLHNNGNLGMFDNGGDGGNPLGSRYVEYEITGTHGNYIATKVYEYRDSSLFSGIMSDADFTGENYQNLLMLYGAINGGRTVILEAEKNTKNVLFRLDLPIWSYRVDKMPLYYDEGRVYSEDCNLKNPN